MTKEEFEKLSEELKADILREIAYEYAVFVPKDEQSALSKFKSFVNLSDKKFLDKTLLEKAKGKSIFPYDVIMGKIEKMVDNYYQEFSLGLNAQEVLKNYGNRGENFNTYFEDCLKKSQNTTEQAIKQELFRQLSKNDAKSAIKGVGDVITRRTSSFGKLLESLFLQMEQLVVLWDYQDNGYTKYRINATGESCEECKSINGKILNIEDVVIGETLSPLHPNCDCTIEILDEQGNVVYTNAKTNKEEQDWEKYLQASIKQLVLGNYTDDVNLVGTLLQVLAGVVGVDLPLDIRDLFYDVTNFELTKQHIGQTLLDAVALLPLVGGVKYIDEAGAVLKSSAKYGDEVTDAIKSTAKYSDETVDSIKHSIKYPGNNPAKSPGEGFEWRGRSSPVDGKGNWYNPVTKERWNADLNHGEPIGPHWDYTDSNGKSFRVFPNGHIESK